MLVAGVAGKARPSTSKGNCKHLPGKTSNMAMEISDRDRRPRHCFARVAGTKDRKQDRRRPGKSLTRSRLGQELQAQTSRSRAEWSHKWFWEGHGFQSLPPEPINTRAQAPEAVRQNPAVRFDIKISGIDGNLLLSEDAMARAVITTDFASPAETAQVLGVSRANREKLVRMAELAISRTGSRGGKAGSNGVRTISRRARKRR